MSERRGRLASIPKQGHREDLGFSVRSAWEANFARYLRMLKETNQILDWAYEAVRFDFPVARGIRSYLPDFQVTENNGTVIYYEVKGYMDAASRTKLNRMKRYHPNVVVHVIDRERYEEIRRKLGPAIRGWE